MNLLFDYRLKTSLQTTYPFDCVNNVSIYSIEESGR